MNKLKIYIKKDKLNSILINSLEYLPEEVTEMTDDEKIDCFVGAGYFEIESDFGGIYNEDNHVENGIDFELVSDITGVPVSLDDYLEKTKKVKIIMK